MALHILDSVVFGVLISSSIFIGLYFGWVKKIKSLNEYMVGDNPSVIPILLSIVVTMTTPKHLISDATEAIMFGTQSYVNSILARLIACPVVIFCFLPVLLELKGRSLYEYFDRRHGTGVRTVAVVLGLLKEGLIVPILVYIPSLLLQNTVGIPYYISSSAVVLVCLFYTCIGGLHAVIWADTLQYIYIFVAILVACIIGVGQVGGIPVVWQRSLEGERVDYLHLGNDPLTDRVSLINGIGSNVIYLIALMAGNQSFYQRLFAVKGRSQSKRVVILSYIGTSISNFGGVTIGLIVYAYFKGCHPLLTQDISKADQIVPYFIDIVSKSFPGLLGLFSAGIISASLSTMSTTYNTMACIIHDELIKPVFKEKLTEKISFRVVKLTVVVLALASLAGSFLCQSIQSLHQTVHTLNGLTSAGVLVVHLMGMVIPCVNSKGVISGAAAGIATAGFFMYQSFPLLASGKLVYATKLISNAACNSTQFTRIIDSSIKTSGFPGPGTRTILDPDVARFSAVTFSLFGSITATISIIVGIIVSWCTGGVDMAEMDDAMICPQLRWAVRRAKERKNRAEYRSVPISGDELDFSVKESTV